jgi:carbonic anhydrase
LLLLEDLREKDPPYPDKWVSHNHERSSHLRIDYRATQHELLKKLEAGNRRFVDATTIDRTLELEYTRKLLAKDGQKPWAVMIGCSDSRVPIEKVFDAGLGDLFVIRLAGNCMDGGSLGSVEFAVDSFDIGLVILIGHKNCGAVTAAHDPRAKSHSPHMDLLFSRLRMASKYKRKAHDPIDLAKAEKANLEYWKEYIRQNSEFMRSRELSGETLLCSAYYDTFTGNVQFLDTEEWSLEARESLFSSEVLN